LSGDVGEQWGGRDEEKEGIGSLYGEGTVVDGARGQLARKTPTALEEFNGT
jgi:hypothetical protein